MLLITSPRFEEHVTPPGHPERMERARVFDAAAARWVKHGGRTAAPRPATRQELASVHGSAYLDEIAATAGRAVMLDQDTFTSPESCDIALLAAGAAVVAAAHAIEQHEAAFALVRPPGHHAEPDRAMGFCLYNNVAVAAASALAGGLDRVAIVDFDVHHGNGTQHMFYEEPRVLYVSSHQYPFYPGTGAVDEVGAGPGRGFTVNLPLEAGAMDEDYDLVYRELVVPVLAEFSPQLLLVSAGFDVHERDPLASMRMTTAGCAALVGRLAAAAPDGAVAFVTEGGYDLEALAACLEASFGAASGTDTVTRPAETAPSSRGERTLKSVRAAQAPFWRGI
jgi:acetoin utilization deacetylase AcuC-like enzyme